MTITETAVASAVDASTPSSPALSSTTVEPFRGVVGPETDEAAWDAFVRSRADACGYQLWAWRRVIEHAFGHSGVYLSARDGGEIVGVLPLIFLRSLIFGSPAVSVPFVNYGGVLARDASVARALLDAAAGIARERRASHIELRHMAQVFADLPAKRHKVTMLLKLPATEKAAWDALDRKVRNLVRKAADKSGLTTAVGGAELLGEFYDVFNVNMRDLGTPVYGRNFFEEIFKAFPRETRVYVVRLGQHTVAAGIGYAFGSTIEVPWASSLKEHRALSPNMLLYWTVIQRAIADGRTVLDFGRSTPNEGTYHFKKQWGAEEHPLCWEYRLIGRSDVPDASPKNPKYQLVIALWKRLPVALTSRLGPHIVRSIP